MKDRKVYIKYDNVNSVGYIVKKIDPNTYWVFIESIGITMEIDKKHIQGLDLVFR
jgi:uncharacterized protein YdeI (BOF family)